MPTVRRREAVEELRAPLALLGVIGCPWIMSAPFSAIAYVGTIRCAQSPIGMTEKS